MATPPCPNESQLRAYLLGERSLADLEAISRHIEGCPDCERVVQSVEGQAASFLGRLQSAFPEGSIGDQAPDDQGVTRSLVETITKAGPDSFAPTFQHTSQPDSTVPSNVDRLPDGPLAVSSVRYFGDYEIQSVIGRGGMGVVYRAKQVSLNRPVALKMIKSGVLANDSELRRFQNEAEAVALLDHPGIVPLYEVGVHEGQRYFSMKLIDGGNLADLLASFKEDLAVAVSMLAETTDAVQHAHIRGVLHRDLKPANILIDAARHPHITDFGLAKRLEGNVELTATGAVMGTPSYMSPEQAAGHHGAITTATDVYGLGAILYAMLTGNAPFGGESVIETLDAVRTRLPLAPRKLNAKVHRDLELICLKCLEKNPIDRYPTAASLADDLRRFAAGEPVSVRAAGFVERSAKWARRKPTLAAAYSLGSLAALLGGLGGLASWQWRDAERARGVAEVARSQAVQSRADAEVARGQAERLRGDADRLRDIAELQRERIERIEYGRTIEVARQEWSDNNVAATRELLQATKPEFRGWEWSYLDRLAHAYSIEIRGVDGAPPVFSPDGGRFVTSSDAQTAKVWDARTGAEILKLKGHAKAIASLAFSRDGSRILTVSDDNTAKVWDAKTGTLICSVPIRHVPWFGTYASFSPDGSRILTPNNNDAGTVAEVKVWNARTGNLMLTLKGHGDLVLQASFSPDGTRILTVGGDMRTKIWDARTGAESLSLGAGLAWFTGGSFSPDGSRVVTYGAGMSGKIENGLGTRIWDAATGVERLKIQLDVGRSDSLTFSPDGLRLLYCRHDKTVVYDAVTGVEIATIRGHTGAITSAGFSLDGALVVTASEDQTAKVWDGRTGEELFTLRGHTDFLVSASFSPDGAKIVTSAKDGTVKVWEARRADVLSFPTGTNRSRNWAACFSPDGAVIVTAGSVRDATTGAEIQSLEYDPRVMFNTLGFSPDSTQIISARGFSPEFEARVWDRFTGHVSGKLQGLTSPVNSCSYSNDGTRILTSNSGEVCEGCAVPLVQSEARVWDSRTAKVILTIKDEPRMILWASFSPDGSRIVTTGISATKIWDAKSGELILSLTGHAGEKAMACYSPDGSRIVTAGNDKTARIWDAATGKELFVLRGHTGSLTSASFSPNGSRIVTSSLDMTAKVWDTATGTHMVTLKGHRGAVRSASFSPDGRRIITASEDGTTRVWETAPINREILAKRPTPPPLSPSITLASRLPAVMRGEDRPADFAERASFARLARQKQHYAAAARWWGELLEANPKLGDDTMGFREMAAYDAALAAAGRGKDQVSPDEATKATLRRQALAWLKSDLVVQAKTLKSDNAPFPDVVEALYHIKLAPQLAGIRDPEVLAKITEDERNSCEAFWAEVDQLLKREERVSMLDPDNERSLISLHIRARALVASHPKEAEPYVRWVLEGYRKRLAQGRSQPEIVIELIGNLAGILERTDRNAEAEPLLLDALELARKYFEKTDVRTMKLMALLGSNLVDQSKWSEAETVLRALLPLYEKSQPDDWTTFNTCGVLGACLLGQQKFDEAEPLIVSAYAGMKAREAKIPPGDKPRQNEAAERVVKFYEAWGKPDKAAEWRAKLTNPADAPKVQP